MENNMLKEIIKNVNKTIEIKRIAQKENVDFKTAKIMFDDGNYDIEIDTARKIKEIITKYRISIDMAQRLITKDDNLTEIKESDIYYEIYHSNDIISKNEEIKKIGDYEGYTAQIYSLMKSGISIEDADKLLQFKINSYSKHHNVSKLISTLKIVYGLSKEKAIKCEEILNFFEKEGRTPNKRISEDLREYVYYSDVFKKKTVNGIMIASKTEEGLKKLEDIINESFIKGKKEFIKQLEEKSEKEKLIITDYNYDNTSCYYGPETLICLNTNRENMDRVITTFFHETSHFLDWANSNSDKKYYSETEKKVRETFEEIRTEINNAPFNSIIKNEHIPSSIRNLIQEASSKTNAGIYLKGLNFFKSTILPFQINNILKKYTNDERLNQKWREEIEKKYFLYSKEDRDLFFKQKLNYEKQKYLTLIGSIYDIYDGLSKGILNEHLNTPGHGKNYFSEENNDLIEFVACVGAIYNNNGEDLLEFEFGQELSHKIIELYNNLIKNKEMPRLNVVTYDELKNDLDQDKKPEISSTKSKIAILKNLKEYLKRKPTNNRKNTQKR